MKRTKTYKAAAHYYALCIAHGALIMSLCINTSCTSEEIEGNVLGNRYPLKIAGVTVSDSQTRISEGTSATQWEGGETIGVKIGDGEVGKYTVNSDGSVTAVTPCYWQSSASQTVTAWYPYDQTVDLSDQSQGLAYSLKAEAKNVSFDQSTTLTFYNQLAKVRVKVLNQSGDQITYAPVKINGIAMHLNSTDKCYEACLEPGTLKASDALQLTFIGKTITTSLANDIELKAGTINTITTTTNLTAKELTLDNDITINDDGTYYITGSGTHTITINGSPTVILDNTSFTANNNTPITVNGGTPTIILSGTNTISFSSIYYNQVISLNNSAGVIIDGQDSGTLTVFSEYYFTDGALIGANSGGTASDIVIKNATLNFNTGTTWSNRSFDSPIIGSGNAHNTNSICGDINIENSTLNVSGHDMTMERPAIGAGTAFSNSENSATSQCGNINITNSTLNMNLLGNSSYPFIGSSVATCNIDINIPSKVESLCGSITITLKEGDSKDAFLARLTGDSNYDGDKIDCGSIEVDGESHGDIDMPELPTKISICTLTSSIGTVTWKDSSGNVLETEDAKTNTRTDTYTINSYD